jgi:hypothetical protein
MTARKRDQGKQPPAKNRPGTAPPATGQRTPPVPKALPRRDRRPETGAPESGSGQGRVDVTGIMPEGIRPDPDITEGHPGYEDSGSSEIIPTQRL